MRYSSAAGDRGRLLLTDSLSRGNVVLDGVPGPSHIFSVVRLPLFGVLQGQSGSQHSARFLPGGSVGKVSGKAGELESKGAQAGAELVFCAQGGVNGPAPLLEPLRLVQGMAEP